MGAAAMKRDARIYVAGHGHGTYAGFTGRWVGANETLVSAACPALPSVSGI